MPQPVLDAITNHLLLEADIGGYEAEAEAADAIEGSRSSLAQLLGAPTDRVAFTEHATASFVAALSAVDFQTGDLIATTRADYASNQIAYPVSYTHLRAHET